MHKAFPFVAAALVATVLFAGTAMASPSYNVSVVGAGVTQMIPADDYLTLSDGSNPAAFGTFALQPGNFFVGYSPGLDHVDYTFAISQLVTIDGQTLAVTVDVSDYVTYVVDTLTILPSPATYFSAAGVNFQIVGFISSALPTGGSQPIELQATLSPVPEPASLALLGVGLAGIGLLRRRS